MVKSIERLRKEVDTHRLAEHKMLAFSEVTLDAIKDKDSSNQAKFLANICVQLDERFGTGSQLTLEWMVDHYMGMEYFKNITPLLNDLFAGLVEGKHTYVNKWEHDKGYAYYIPCKDKKVLVMTNENYDWSWLVIIDENSISQKTFVRKIWSKTKLNCIGDPEQPTLRFYRGINFKMSYDNGVYGDCRDNGHIMSYEALMKFDDNKIVHTPKAGKCDAAIHYLSDNTRWFMEVGFLHCEMTET